MPAYLLDTDCCIFSLSGNRFPALRTRLGSSMPGSIGVSTITLSELLLGSVQGKPPTPERLEKFLLQIVTLPFDEAAARAYAGLPFKRARFDRLLAAHALSLGATVITNNEADFTDVPGLRVENWTLPL